TEVQVVWTFHHVLLDGWSLFRVLADVFACHAALAGGQRPELVVRRPFRDYLHWLSTQDHASAEQHWQQVLSGFEHPTSLPYDQAPLRAHNTHSSHSLPIELTDHQSTQLRQLAQHHGLTLNTILQGAWAILLSRYSAQRDICFGATVSGRPADLSGVEEIIGIFINTLPIRVDVAPTAGIIPWLQQLQATQAHIRRFDSASLTQLHTLSDLPAGTTLFDSILVFENYPINNEVAAAHGLQLSKLHAIETTNFPLALIVGPSQQLSLELGYDPTL